MVLNRRRPACLCARTCGPVPDWLRRHYDAALQTLLGIALDRSRGASDRDLTRVLIEVVAAAKGRPLQARVSTFAEDELREMLGA